MHAFRAVAPRWARKGADLAPPVDPTPPSPASAGPEDSGDPAPRTTLPAGAWRVYVGVQLCLTALYFAVPARSLLQAVVFVGVLVGCLAAVAVGIRLRRPAQRQIWHLLVATQVTNLSAYLVWYLMPAMRGDDMPSSGIADALFIVAYILMIVTVFALLRARHAIRDRAAALDAVVLLIPALWLGWVYLISPYAEASDMTVTARLVAIAYPVLD